MTIPMVVFAVLAALLHVYIFVLESFRWTEPSTRKTFGVSEQDAAVLAPMAYNQGFYNLFLAIITLVGLAMYKTEHVAGSALAWPGPARCSWPRSCWSPTTGRWREPR